MIQWFCVIGYSYQMSDSRIKNIASLQKMRENAKGLQALKTVFPIARPLLKLLHVDTDAIADAFAKVEHLERETIELISLPDRFNDLFVSRGWIIYDLLNMGVVKEAIRKGELGDVDGAEGDLVEYYTLETIEFQLRAMRGITAFRERSRLAFLAATDYAEGRYHACIPVVLALMDGLVNEINEANRGIFAEGTELKAWDSVSAHARGWGELIKLLSKGRRKTYTETIDIPYRNGILHGMDLGYDNKMVAAKTWAALFSTREWALKAEQGKLVEPLPEPKLTWRDTFKRISENEASKKLQESWQPRDLQMGSDVPLTGKPEEFIVDTPERRLAEFLNFWLKRNFGYMAQCLPADRSDASKPSAQRMRDHFSSRELTGFTFTSIEDTASAVCVINANLFYAEESILTPKEFSFRMIYQDGSGSAMVRGQVGGSWVVYNALYL